MSKITASCLQCPQRHVIDVADLKPEIWQTLSLNVIQLCLFPLLYLVPSSPYLHPLCRCSETDQVSQDRLAQGDPSDQKDEPHVPEEMPFTQMYPQASEHRQGKTVPDPDPDPDPGPGQGEAVPDPDPGQGSVPGGEAPGGADGGAGPVVLGRHEQMESSAQGEQMETDPGSPPTTRGR